MKKKFAFILMSDAYNPDVHQASFEKETMSTHIYTAASKRLARSLRNWRKRGSGQSSCAGPSARKKRSSLLNLPIIKLQSVT